MRTISLSSPGRVMARASASLPALSSCASGGARRSVSSWDSKACAARSRPSSGKGSVCATACMNKVVQPGTCAGSAASTKGSSHRSQGLMALAPRLAACNCSRATSWRQRRSDTVCPVSLACCRACCSRANASSPRLTDGARSRRAFKSAGLIDASAGVSPEAGAAASSKAVKCASSTGCTGTRSRKRS